jgi:hypothetical protein
MFYEVTEASNRNMVAIAEMIDQQVFELLHCASAGVSDIAPPDLERFTEGLNDIKTYATWVESAGGTDNPETHPYKWPITYLAKDEIGDCENKAIRDVVREYRTLQNEVLRSQSAKLAAGWHGPDKERRFDPGVARIERFRDDYVASALPRDLPESTSSKEPVGPGYGT